MEAHYRRSARVWSLSSILSDEQFTVAQLRVEDYTQAEIAREMGLSQSMISVLLRQIGERLEKHKVRHGEFPEFDLG